MTFNTALPVFNKFLDFLVEKATPQEILAFHVSKEEEEYLQELVYRNNAGTLTPEETAYLDQAAEFDLLVTVMKAKALKALKKL